MSKYLNFRLSDPIYKTALEIFISADPEEFRKFLKYHGADQHLSEITGGTTGKYLRLNIGDCTKAPKANVSVIWLRSKNMGTLVHELTHHVMCTFDEKDIPMSWDSTETFTYYLEMLLNQVLELWKPKRKKHGK